MVNLELQATMSCEKVEGEGDAAVTCIEVVQVDLVLLTTGGFGVAHLPEGWQLVKEKGQVFGPFIARCPKHREEESRIARPPKGFKVKQQIGPAGRRVVLGGR